MQSCYSLSKKRTFQKIWKYIKSAIVLTMSAHQNAEVILYIAIACKENVKFVLFIFSPSIFQFFLILKRLCDYELFHHSFTVIFKWLCGLTSYLHYATTQHIKNQKQQKSLEKVCVGGRPQKKKAFLQMSLY